MFKITPPNPTSVVVKNLFAALETTQQFQGPIQNLACVLRPVMRALPIKPSSTSMFVLPMRGWGDKSGSSAASSLQTDGFFRVRQATRHTLHLSNNTTRLRASFVAGGALRAF
jgi:hypothetical protein